MIVIDDGMQLNSILPGTEYTPSDNQPLLQFAGNLNFHTITYLYK